MLGSDLAEKIKECPSVYSHFKGVFAINKLPKSLKKRQFLFCNTDVSTGNGIHWQCLLKNDDNSLEYFDSLGISQQKLVRFAIFSKINCKTIIFNETALQLETSDSCGKFCLYFAIIRLHNLDISFNSLINDIFSHNNTLNESKVEDFLKSF